MTRVAQAVAHPTVVFHARNIETGDEALILTTAIDVDAFPELAGFDHPVTNIALPNPPKIRRAPKRQRPKEPESMYEQWKVGRRHW